MITLCSWPCPRNVRVCSCAVLAAARPGHGTHTAGCICTASAAPGQPTGASGLPHPRAVSNAPAESRKELRLRPGTPVQQTHPCITAQGQPGLTLLPHSSSGWGSSLWCAQKSITAPCPTEQGQQGQIPLTAREGSDIPRNTAQSKAPW